MRLRVLVRMRWLAILGIIIATLVASNIFHISFPVLPVYAICVAMAFYNLLLFRQARNLEREKTGFILSRGRAYSNFHILFDLLALASLLHFTGGIENPFIFYFVLHIIAGSIILHYRVVYFLATAAISLVALLVGLEYAGVVPHHNLEGFASPMLYQDGGHILAVLIALATILYATAYMTTAISGELRKRQRQVVELSERLLQRKNSQLEQASGEISKLEQEKERFLRFLSIAAHDLKAPLTAIQGFLWVILGGFAGEVALKQKSMLERSSRRINELLSLISDLLDIPRIENGQIVQEMKWISMHDVVKHSCDVLRGSAKEKGISLKVDLPKKLPKIHGSSSRLKQVFTNLVDNAINYTPEGVVTVRAREGPGEISIEVVDTGIGIPAQDLPRVFEDFFRAGNVEVKGTGLGLAIAKRIIEAHKGKIWVESPCPETGKGSKFICSLPKERINERGQR